MSYTFDIVFGADPGLTDLRAQLLNSTGGVVGAAISTGFTELGAGLYLWHYTAFPDGHRGAVKFFSSANPTLLFDAAAVNPEEGENLDAKITSRSTLTGPDIHTQIANALSVDTIAELAQGVPAATPTLYQAISLLYMMIRNGVTEDGTWKKLYNDAGTCIAKWQTVDAGAVFTVHKAVTGP